MSVVRISSGDGKEITIDVSSLAKEFARELLRDGKFSSALKNDSDTGSQRRYNDYRYDLSDSTSVSLKKLAREYFDEIFKSDDMNSSIYKFRAAISSMNSQMASVFTEDLMQQYESERISLQQKRDLYQKQEKDFREFGDDARAEEAKAKKKKLDSEIEQIENKRNQAQGAYRQAIGQKRQKTKEALESEGLSENSSYLELESVMEKLQKEVEKDKQLLEEETDKSKLNEILERIQENTDKINLYAEERDKREKSDREFRRKTDGMGILAAFSGYTNGGTTPNAIDKIFGKSEGSLTHTISTFLGSSSPIAIVLNTILGAVNLLGNKFDDAVNSVLDTYTQYMGPISTRLQGSVTYDVSDGAFKYFADKVSSSIVGDTPYITVKGVLASINSLVAKGVANDLETRAVLAELGERMVTTFEHNSDVLLRNIRLNQGTNASMYTQAAMGAESYVTQLLNGIFKDSSYLNGTYDTVYAALTDAMSLMNAQQAMEFNYAIQSWLGAMQSVGVSESTLTSLASGLNALATGDVSALGGNQGWTVLFARAAEMSGLDYSEMLTNGLDKSSINALMPSIIELLQEIASGADNNVTKKAMTEIVGVAVSDLKGALNLTPSQIAQVSQTVNSTTYQSMLDETIRQAEYAISDSRVHVSTLIDNAIENFMYDWGERVVGDQSSYLFYKLADVVSSMSGGVGTIGNLAKGIIGIAELFRQDSFSNISSQVTHIFDRRDATRSNAVEQLLSLAGLSEGFQGAYDSWGARLLANTLNNMDEVDRFATYMPADTSAWDSLSQEEKQLRIQAGTSRDLVMNSGVSTSKSTSGTATNKARNDISMVALDAYDEAMSATTTITGASNIALVRTASDIYYELFDRLTHVKIDLSEVETNALNALYDKLIKTIEGSVTENTANTTAIREKLVSLSTGGALAVNVEDIEQVAANKINVNNNYYY